MTIIEHNNNNDINIAARLSYFIMMTAGHCADSYVCYILIYLFDATGNDCDINYKFIASVH